MNLSDWMARGFDALKSITSKNGRITVDIAQARAVIEKLPTSVTQGQLNAFIGMAERFLSSRFAKMVSEQERDSLEVRLEQVKAMPLNEAWASIRSYLNEDRVLAQFAEPLLLFAVEQVDTVPDWMRALIQ